MKSRLKFVTVVVTIAGMSSAALAEAPTQVPAAVTLTWGNIISLAATTGILIALLNQIAGFAKHWIEDRRTTKRRSRSLALQLISVVEKFALQCCYEIEKTQYQYDPSEDEQRLPTKVPELEPLYALGTSDEWAAVDPKLSTMATTMNSERDEAANSANVVASLIGQECDVQGVYDSYYGILAKVGLRAALLGSKLRKRYGASPEPDDAIVRVRKALADEKTKHTVPVSTVIRWIKNHFFWRPVRF